MSPSAVGAAVRRVTLAAALLAGKGLDAASTVVVLRLVESARETVPLSRALMAEFGPVGGMAVLTVLTVVVVGLLAESGVVIARVADDAPEWYVPTLRAAVYLGCAAWFGLVGVWNLTLLL